MTDRATTERSDLVGRVVWAFAGKGNETVTRSIHLIAGLRPEHLAGISRMMPADLAGTVVLAIRKDIEGLTAMLPAEHLTDHPAVHYRNSDKANLILVAVSDSERETVGASLNPVSRIDRNSLQQMSDLWLDEILEHVPARAGGEERRVWIEAALDGFNRSGVAKELDQFAEFARLLRQRLDKPWEERIRLALPAVHLPVNSVDSLPGISLQRDELIRKFETLFRDAERDTAGYPYLLDKGDKPVDPTVVLNRLDELGPGGTAEEKRGFAAIRGLLDDRRNLRPGDWRESQEVFCKDVNWKTVGTIIFDIRKQRKSTNLGDRTLEFLRAEHHAELEKTDEVYLENLKIRAKTSDDDHNFFDRWQDKIRAAKSSHLYEAWRRHLYPDEVREDDLQVAILKGIQTLLMMTANDDGSIATGSRIRFAVRHGEKRSTWSKLDERVYALLRLEGQLLEQVLAPHVRFEFGSWLDLDAIGMAKGQKTRASRQVEFEMSLIDNAEDSDKMSPRVRVFWEPGHTSIALALPADIEALYQGFAGGSIRVHRETFALKPGGEAGAMPATLADTESFVDVAGRGEGRTANPSEYAANKDIFSEIRKNLSGHVEALELDPNAFDEIAKALDVFRTAFGEAIEKIHTDPRNAYQDGIIERQTAAFGDLCRVARLKLQGSTACRHNTMWMTAEFGIVISENDRQAAIIPGWHPLRIMERRAKAFEMADFISKMLDTETVSSDGLDRSCADREQLLKTWFYPEVASVGLETFAAVEHRGGYSFAIPVSSTTAESRDLNSTTETSVREYVDVTRRYLELNPHEEGNFSTAIFNSDTISLPERIANELKRRMALQPNLRCSLLITHDDPACLRTIYAEQNARLNGHSVDEITEGFLSRLRIGVGAGNTGQERQSRSSTDIVFLHNSIYRLSELSWTSLPGTSWTLPDCIDFRNAMMPRRITEGFGGGATAAKGIQLALSASHPPRACALFLDLCFAAHKDQRHFPEEDRALPVRNVDWDSGHVRNMIGHAHDIGAWVVTVDSMASRKMLIDNGIKVIRDKVLIDSDMRVLVSSRKPSENLRWNMVADFAAMEDVGLHESPDTVADDVISSVVEVCGQKILGSVRSRTGAREIIGIAAAIAIVEKAAEDRENKPVWFSLDDNPAFFGLRGRMADTLALRIQSQDNGRFVIEMTVVEAKCVSASVESEEVKSSRQQTVATLETLRTNFCDQKGSLAPEAWGLSLLQLLSLRPDYVRFFADRNDLDRFRRDLANGAVDYKARGISVIVIHDDVSAGAVYSVETIPDDDAVQQYRVGQRALGRLLVGEDIEKETGSPEPVTPPVTPLVPRSIESVLPDQAQTPEKEPPCSALKPEFATALQAVADANRADEALVKIKNQAEQTARDLQAALVEFGMTASLHDPAITVTPNGVLIHFKGHPSFTVRRLEPRILELRTTYGLDVVDIRAGLGRISLFVAARKRQVVDLAQVWLDAWWPETAPGHLANFLVGVREDNGQPLWLNLQGGHGNNGEHSPHTLIAGETGSGKGVLTQNLLLQMIAFNAPSALQLYVIDPKHGVDFAWIRNAPHLVRPLVTAQEESVAVLEEIVEEMERRYKLFEKRGATKVSEYNAKVEFEEKLPFCVVVHDEMADWMAIEDYRKCVLECFKRIAAKARAAGIHIIMITQRADKDAIPVGIRDNLGNRLCLRVAGEAGSKLALGKPGAERLLSRGHVAASLGGDKPDDDEFFIAQVPFASTDDLTELSRIINNGWR